MLGLIPSLFHTDQMADIALSSDRPNSTKFISWNVKAMNSPVKRSKVFYSNVIPDSNGRYVIITGTLWHTPVKYN